MPDQIVTSNQKTILNMAIRVHESLKKDRNLSGSPAIDLQIKDQQELIRLIKKEFGLDE